MTSASVAFLCALLVLATPASAEWFGDLWAGATRTQSEDLEVEILDVTVSDKVDYPDTFTFGLRVGYWFERLPWLGLAGDASHFKPDSDVVVFPISALLMLRIPILRSSDFPGGQFQPYVAGGPGVFISRFSGDLGEDLGGHRSHTAVDLGLDLRAGFTFLFIKDFGIYLEYRMTRFSPEWKLEVLDTDAKIKTDLNSHHLIGGVTFRFQF